MLVEFTVGNYRSFRSHQTLSMVAAPKLKSRDHSLDVDTLFPISDNLSLLTRAAIYGPNASGKSNLVQAIQFMRSFVLNSPRATSATGGIEVEPFRLNATTLNQPSHFEIVFIESETRYRYGFEVTQERVTSEWLHSVPSTREARLFERDGDIITIGNHFKEGRGLDLHTRPNALFLSVVAQLNGPTSQKLLNWFRRLSVISGLQDMLVLPYTLRQLHEGENGEAIKQLICRLDLGIADLKVEKSARQSPPGLERMPDEMRKAFTTLLTLSGDERLSVRTVHLQYDDTGNPLGQELFDLEVHESDGTQKLLAISGPLLNTLQEGRVLFVDELDARLHPLMTREILALFNRRAGNSNGAQLIFNTHDTNLLDNKLLRRDQIWFVEKDEQGESHLYSLAEFRVRNDKSYERGYIQGRYGAIPYLGDIRTVLSSSNAQET